MNQNSLLVLDEKELVNIESFLGSIKSTFLTEIITYTKLAPNMDFITYSGDGKSLNTIQISKTRLNKKLRYYNYFVDKNYILKKINTLSPSYIFSEIEKLFKNMKTESIKSIKVFDAYTQTNKKDKVFKSINLIFKNILNQNIEIKDTEIKILSNFNNEKIGNFGQTETKDFLKRLLIRYEDLNIDLRYMRESLIFDSSLFYILIIDNNDNEYIYYIETITEFVTIAKVDNTTLSTSNFFKMLDKRFEYYFDQDGLNGLLEKSSILKISLDTLNQDKEIDFQNKIIELINDITLFVKDSKQKSSITIQKEINDLIKKLKVIKVLFPASVQVNNIMYNYIKISEIIAKLTTSNDFPQTRDTLKKIINKRLEDEVHTRLLDIINKNHFSFRDADFNDISFKKLRLQLFNKRLNETDSLIDIYNEYNFNTLEQTKKSLNSILENKKYDKLINLYLVHKNVLDEFNFSSLYKKVIFRGILKTFFKISLNAKLNLNREQVINLHKLDNCFTNQKIVKTINTFYKKRVFRKTP